MPDLCQAVEIPLGKQSGTVSGMGGCQDRTWSWGHAGGRAPVERTVG